MDEDKKQKLLEKRKLLKEEVQKKELKSRLKYEINYLEANGLTYSIYYKHEYLYWMQNHFPIRIKDGYYGQHDYQIDIDEPNKNCSVYSYKTDKELHAILKKELLKNYRLEDEVVICRNGGDPELVVSINTLLSDINIFTAGFEIWFILKDKTLVIEYISGTDSVKFIKNKN